MTKITPADFDNIEWIKFNSKTDNNPIKEGQYFQIQDYEESFEYLIYTYEESLNGFYTPWFAVKAYRIVSITPEQYEEYNKIYNT